MGKELKTKDLLKAAAERGKRDDNKTQPKTRDSLRQGASQAAGAAPTLRYGPAGDSAPRLRLKAAGMAERFLFGASAPSLSDGKGGLVVLPSPPGDRAVATAPRRIVSAPRVSLRGCPLYPRMDGQS